MEEESKIPASCQQHARVPRVWGVEPLASLPSVPVVLGAGSDNLADEWVSAWSTHVSILLVSLQRCPVRGLSCVRFRGLFSCVLLLASWLVHRLPF